jgi:hypothetical protein
MEKEDKFQLNEKVIIDAFKQLSEIDREYLYKAPVFVSVLAASTNNRINKKQKADALKLARLKTFTARPELIFFYKIVEKNFKDGFEELEKQYKPFNKQKREALIKELEKVDVVISKLDKRIAEILHKSLNEYAHHIKKAGIGILDDFVFPLPIKGLTY